MQQILQKIFTDRVYIHFLIFASCCMIFVIPIGSHVYRYLGPAMLLFFVLTKFFQGELSRTNLKRIKINKPMILFALLLGLSCVSFVPQTFGTMLIFVTLYFGIKEKVVVNPRLAKLFLILIMLVLAVWIYKYENRLPVYGALVNNNYLAVKFILFFLCCVKLSFGWGRLFTVIGSFLVASRTLFVGLIANYLLQIPFIKKRLSAKAVAIYFSLSILIFLGGGALFAEKVVTVPTRPQYHNWQWYKKIKLYRTTLNRCSAGRIKLNNNFFNDISGDYNRILFGAGLSYKGTEIKRKKYITPVHNSFLDIFARQGILFLAVYLILLYSYISKYGCRNDYPVIISLITFGMLFNGMFNTFPLITLLSLLQVQSFNPEPSSFTA